MRIIPFINFIVLVLVAITTLLIASTFVRTPTLPETAPLLEKQLIKSSFETMSDWSTEKGPLALAWVEPTLRLPDLASQLIYYGPIQRPDIATTGPTPFYLSFRGSSNIYYASSGVPFYVLYRPAEEGEMRGEYLPSPTPTPLWMEMGTKQKGQKLEVTVHMQDEKGQEVASPEEHRQFTLFPQEAPRQQGAWELGEYRVDTTLLIRQKGRWIGKDIFLEQHGGAAYAHASGRERIDFNFEEDSYSCFVKAGDFLIWQEGKWREGYLSKEPTLGLPLLLVTHIEERIMHFELWDGTGLSKLSLSLIKARDLGGMPSLAEGFRFVGAKTWAQFIIETDKGRMVLRAHDWLVLTSEGWIVLDSEEKLDAYVAQKLVGPLLVLEKVKRENGKQILTGYLYNTTRTEEEVITLHAEVAPSLAVLQGSL